MCITLLLDHLHYSAQLWGQTNTEDNNKIRVLQNRALRRITFKRLHDSTNEIYKNLKILRFSDSVCMQNCLLMTQIERNEKIALSFSTLKYCRDNHNYQTRSAIIGNFLKLHVLAQISMAHYTINQISLYHWLDQF